MGTAASRAVAPESSVQCAATRCATPHTAPKADSTLQLMLSKSPRIMLEVLSGQLPKGLDCCWRIVRNAFLLDKWGACPQDRWWLPVSAFRAATPAMHMCSYFF
eukprot:1157872-Pelagomonas_calceolata.AAC.4